MPMPSVSDVMSLFRTAPSSAPGNTQPNGNVPTGNQGGPGLPNTQQTQHTAPNGVVPVADPKPNAEPKELVSPFDKHSKVWETEVDPNAEPDGGYFGSLDPAKVMESAKKVDFAKIVTPEVLAKITAGGQSATEALLVALNAVSQNVYANSAIASTKIVEQGLARMQARLDKRIPGMVRNLSVREGLRAENPLMSDPAVAPVIEALTTQFGLKNPGATSSEISTQVQDYLSTLATAFAPKAPETPESRRANKAAKGEDWDKFLE